MAASTRHSGQSPLLLRAFIPVVCQAQPSVLKGVQDCRLPGVKRLTPLKPLKPLKRSAAASTRHSGHSPLLLRAFKPAVCQASNPYNRAWQLRPGTQASVVKGVHTCRLQAQPSVLKGVQDCRLPGVKRLKPLKPPKTLRSSFDQALRPQPSVVKGVQDCRLPGLKPLQPLKPLKPCVAASTRHSGHSRLLLRAFKPVVCQAAFSFPSYFFASPATCGYCYTVDCWLLFLLLLWFYLLILPCHPHKGGSAAPGR